MLIFAPENTIAMSVVGNIQEEQKWIHLLKVEDSVEAFNRLYDAYARRLYAFCLQYSKCPEDSEEIVQDVFVWLWENRKTIRKEESVKNLLFIRTRHFLINAYRKTVNSPTFEDYVDYQNSLGEESNGTWLEYREFVAQLKQHIGQLPLTQQNVIRLSKIENLSNREIAQQLQLSEQTVKNQLSIGLKTLRARMGLTGWMALCFTIWAGIN